MGAIIVAMEQLLAGRLLVASPSLVDPNFARTVVLMLNHSAEGALGVVLNRPLPEAAATHVPAWDPYLSPPAVLFRGGPVEPAVAIGIGRTGGAHPGPGWTELPAGLALLDLSLDAGSLENLPRDLRLFSGYAGWGSGQLEGEIEEGAWFVVDFEPGDPFAADPETLWRRVLRRQQGKLAIFAYFPEQPGAN